MFERQACLLTCTFLDLFANLYGPPLLIKTWLLATLEGRNRMDQELGQKVRKERKRPNKDVMIEVVTYKRMLITNISILF